MPGSKFLLDDGTEGPTGNLHMGIFNAANARPHPDPAGVEPRDVPATDGRTARTWILVSDDDSIDRILDEAESRGATILWRDHYLGGVQRLQRARSSTRGATRSCCG